MNKEFSEGFVHDVADILELCMDNETDNISLEMKINDHTLIMDIHFRIKEEEWV